MDEQVDVVIVGGGIAGATLGANLAADGLAVVVLEASPRYEDRVRGESMQPWGVAEARELGVEQVLLDAGARLTHTWVHYDPMVPTADSLANPLPVGMIRPDVAGSMNLLHPEACAALAAHAARSGAVVLHGISDVIVRAGEHPEVEAVGPHGVRHHWHPRLVVGADGRSSTVRRQVGIELERYGPTHFIAGVLLDGLDDVPAEQDFLVSGDDVFMASFHQHPGQIRVYLCPGVSGRHRFSGPNGLAEFLRTSALDGLPFGERLAEASPIGPLATYPGDDTWTERPYAPGVVLVGDAAGHNSPIIGQGLSIALRDVRLVRDTLRAGGWRPEAFEAYAAERVERMRRLRAGASFMAAAFADDSEDRSRRRARFFELQQTEPLMLALVGGMFGGPELAPAEAFDGELQRRLVAV